MNLLYLCELHYIRVDLPTFGFYVYVCNNIPVIPFHGFSFETKQMIHNKNGCENIYMELQEPQIYLAKLLMTEALTRGADILRVK